MKCPCCQGHGEVAVRDGARGEQLRARREAAGMSLRKVAKRAGISASYLSDLELGKRGLTVGLETRLNAALEPEVIA